jgi:hypothetical protein
MAADDWRLTDDCALLGLQCPYDDPYYQNDDDDDEDGWELGNNSRRMAGQSERRKIPAPGELEYR